MIIGLWSEERDPKRIQRILEKVGKLWGDSPDLRFGQFIQNIFGSAIRNQPVYFKEDDEVEKILDYLLGRKKS
ncbi:hypothetical protein LCGC14_0871660 [marine sediment metagenome]|uniref:Uncharacterized protein n=1 Tax=marine sediment metagenome TaxID=412755 RepID=A0A0F9RP36_9ZZZZ|nr:MAG: hypothetical protein Lokiarch_33120 [Candidatus Lokiarchaeum sp. GC14_75]HEC38158.1 hypothetical protein [bacterium]